jgi:hypothetical protein
MGPTTSILVVIVVVVCLHWCEKQSGWSLSSVGWFAVAAPGSPLLGEDSDSGKVAFVFAGSPRTFVQPIIFKTTKKNLIEGFCPRPQCEPHVFARLSFSDNVHEGVRYSSVGITLPRSDKTNFILSKVKDLAQRVTIEIVDIGSDQEKQEILRHGGNRTFHKIYRELDSRRYSMYYNRWAAYQMAVKAEQEQGFRFEWVVHGRMDFFFGGPVRPYHVYSKIMWAVDQWSYNIPDVFALLPRKFSDIFYSVDEMYAENRVPCLGGPDFFSANVTESALSERGYTQDLIRVVFSELCLNKFPNKARSVIDRDTKVEWSLFGVSEEWLQRKLNYHGIEFNKGTMSYTSFFTVMVRDGAALTFFCGNTKPDSLIGWIRRTQHAPLPMSHACVTMDSELRMLQDLRGSNRTISKYGENCDIYTLATKSQPIDSPQSMCIIDDAVTELNFLPFRIKSEAGECLTVANLWKKASPALPSLSECNATMRIDDVTADYSITQLFHFYPFASQPQRLSNFQYLYDRYSQHCITVATAEVGAVDYRLSMTKCLPSPHQSQLFRVVVLDRSDNRTATVVSTRLQENRILIKWIGEHESYCLSSRAFKKSLSSQKVSKMSLTPCVPANPRQRIPVFQVERTRFLSPTTYIRPRP